jgi:hypothetical protein
MTLGAQTEVILLANSIGLVNESRGEYGTNGINGTNGKIPEKLSVCSVYSVFPKVISAKPFRIRQQDQRDACAPRRRKVC